MEHPDRLSDDLAADLKDIHKYGLARDVKAATLPALAEMAAEIGGEPYDESPDYHGRQILRLLRTAIHRHAESETHALAVERLFDVVEGPSVRGLGDRREMAAPGLNYTDADSLRHTPTEAELRDALRIQLLTIAAERGFVYTERYRRPPREVVSAAAAPDENAPDTSITESTAVPVEANPPSRDASARGLDATADDESGPERHDQEMTTADTALDSDACGVEVADGEEALLDDHEAEAADGSDTNLDLDTSAQQRKQKRSLRWRVVVALGVVLTALVVAFVVVGAFGSGKGYSDKSGPVRPVYDYKLYIGNKNCADGTNPSAYSGRCGAPTDFPVFDSFIHTPYYGDETAFFDGYRAELSNGRPSDPVRNVTSGDGIVVLRIYVDNDAQVHPKEPELTTAHNTRVRVVLPANTGKSLIAYANISAARAITVYDSVDLTSDRPFSLEYIPGSAVLYSRVKGHDRTFRLSDEIIGSEGALIGINSTNGILPPFTDFSGTLVELKVRAVPQTLSH